MHQAAPGTDQKPRRFLPRLRYELIGCGLSGHELLGLDAAEIRAEDHIFVRESDGLRWYRCLRCDSWLPLPPPEHPARPYPPDRAEVDLPLRGRPLRDRYVLRVIAVDRAVHVVLFLLVAALLLAFANRQESLRPLLERVVAAVEGGTVQGRATGSGLGHRLESLLTVKQTSLVTTAVVAICYAVLEGVEAVGLWFAKRWAEYLTLVATAAFLPYEVYELTRSVSWLKVGTLLVNLAIVGYLLWAKRLFGVHGGGRAEHAARERDSGWAAVERATPSAAPAARPGVS